jgi:pilus assembly protein CpaC
VSLGHPARAARTRLSGGLLPRILGLGLALLVLAPAGAAAQKIVSQVERVISVSKGSSVLLVNPLAISRFSVGEPTIAEAIVLSPTEVLINGKGLGTTTLLIWDNSGQVRVNSVEVTADAPGLQRFLKQLMPDEDIQVSASGNTVTVSGNVKDPNSVARAIDIAKGSGATIIDNLVAPQAVQVLVRVRFAEVNRTALKDWSTRFTTLNPHKLDDNGDWTGTTDPTVGNDAITFGLVNGTTANLHAFIAWATQKGDLRTLAEPNLMTLPAKEAYFLAGGEFPYPSVQGGSSSGAVSIIFKEFGIKLKFTPNIARNGAIRLKVAPEVSSLDFANGLTIQGFQIPSLRTRRAETEVELREGQYLAIAGLMDNETTRNLTKIPFLGDIPILGELFKSRGIRDRRTELLVIVSPELVQASDKAPQVPTGEPGASPGPVEWKREGSLKAPSSSNQNPLQPGTSTPSQQPQQ